MKIMTKVALSFIIVVLVFGTVMIYLNSQSVAREKANTTSMYEERGVSIARAIDASITSDHQLNFIAPTLVQKAVANGSGILELSIQTAAPEGVSPTGYWTVASSNDAQVGKASEAQDVRAMAKDKHNVSFQNQSGTRIMDVTYPLHDQNGVPCGTATIKFDMSAVDKILIPSSTYLYIILMIGFALLVGIFMAYSITKPIKQLTQVTNKISAGDLTVHMPDIKSKDEIHDLNEGIKGVLAAVQFLTDEVEKKLA